MRLPSLCLLIFTVACSAFAENRIDYAKRVESDWLRQAELRYHSRDITSEAYQKVVFGGMQLSNDLIRQGVDVTNASTAMKQLENVAASLENYMAARRAIRETVFQNPLLDFDSVLFAKTSPSMFPHMSDQCLSFWHRGGGAICILKNIKSGSPEVIELTKDWKNGTFFRPELSYDGTKVLFAYAEYDPKVAEIADKVNKDNIAEESVSFIFSRWKLKRENGVS